MGSDIFRYDPANIKVNKVFTYEFGQYISRK